MVLYLDKIYKNRKKKYNKKWKIQVVRIYEADGED
jgi:hypothetical protein